MFSDDSDYYAILGLSRQCTLAQIRAAYRALAKQHHPDVNGGSPEAVERLKVLNAAHETLADPVRRRAYDRELPQRQAPPPSERTTRLERNISQDVHLRIDELLRGTTLDVRVNDPGNPNGEEIYSLTIPEETAPGTRFRLSRQAPFEGGHVQVRVKLRPGSRFKAKGSDLQCDLRINARRATQGGSEMVPGPTGAPLRISIPAGIQRGAIVRVAGEGLPKARGGRGDLLVRIKYQPEVRISRAKAW